MRNKDSFSAMFLFKVEIFNFNSSANNSYDYCAIQQFVPDYWSLIDYPNNLQCFFIAHFLETAPKATERSQTNWCDNVQELLIFKYKLFVFIIDVLELRNCLQLFHLRYNKFENINNVITVMFVRFGNSVKN